MLSSFQQHYLPDRNARSASEELINSYIDKVPAVLIEIWKTTGLGKYNDGLIEIINPIDYSPTLWTWLGTVKENYTPIAMTAFGELFYYRKLSETDEDVCILDIQYRKVETLIWSIDSFFNDFLVNQSERDIWLREKLFLEAKDLFDPLKKGEVLTFVPILAFGGGENVASLKVGNARVYQDLVFQMTS